MGRHLDNWLSAYLEYTDQSEPPKAYHTWVGISVIAGALQRHVHLPWGFEKIYPNMYIALVGPSGKSRKGVALGIGKDLLSKAGIPMTAESTTKEALILAMKENIRPFTAPDGHIHIHCSITCFSEEFSVFLGEKDIRFLSALTDWYDSKDHWEYRTKGTGKDHLDGVCFNVCGATAPDWLPSILPKEAVGGGFTSRVLWVVEYKKGKRILKPMITKEHMIIERQLIADLEHINLLVGTVQFSPEAEKAYMNWYEQEDEKLDHGDAPILDPRFASYCDRRATHLRKLMIILSAAHSDSLVISMKDFHQAVAILTAAEKGMGATFSGLGQAKNSEMTDVIKGYIKSSKQITRKDLLKRFYRDVDSQTLLVIEEVLEQMGAIRITLKPETNDKLYTWIGDVDET